MSVFYVSVSAYSSPPDPLRMIKPMETRGNCGDMATFPWSLPKKLSSKLQKLFFFNANSKVGRRKTLLGTRFHIRVWRGTELKGVSWIYISNSFMVIFKRLHGLWHSFDNYLFAPNNLTCFRHSLNIILVLLSNSVGRIKKLFTS